LKFSPAAGKRSTAVRKHRHGAPYRDFASRRHGVIAAINTRAIISLARRAVAELLDVPVMAMVKVMLIHGVVPFAISLMIVAIPMRINRRDAKTCYPKTRYQCSSKNGSANHVQSPCYGLISLLNVHAPPPRKPGSKDPGGATVAQNPWARHHFLAASPPAD
jgi:hypothetical protein